MPQQSVQEKDELSELDAIRARDAEWRDRHPLKDSPGRDRRRLLQYLDGLEALVTELQLDMETLRSRVALIVGSREKGPEVQTSSEAPCAVQEKKEEA